MNIPESMYDYRHERESEKQIDICDICGCSIYEEQEYYDINGKIICQECILEFKKIGGE